jgi:hypothetical protein
MPGSRGVSRLRGFPPACKGGRPAEAEEATMSLLELVDGSSLLRRTPQDELSGRRRSEDVA